MKTLNLVFALLLGLFRAVGQGVTPLPDQTVYPGNPFVLNVVIARPDSAAVASAVLYYGENGRLVEQPSQPVVSRAGRLLSIAWSAAQTRQLPTTATARLYLVISAGPVARLSANVVVTRFPLTITKPGTYTVVSPVAELSETGSTAKTYVLNNVAPSGYRITHNKGTRIVTAVFYRDDTGQIDPVWRIQIIDENTVETTGPPGESFPGRVVLFFPIQTISN